MSEAKGALDSIKAFGQNLGKHKKALVIGGGITAIALTIGYNSLMSNAELTLSKEVVQEAERQSVVDVGKTGGLTSEIKYEEDKTGINDANARLNELDEKSYRDRVYKAAEDDKSEIITRGSSNGGKIRFKSDEKINKLEREKIIQDINVPDVVTQTIVTPPKMTFNDEVAAQEAEKPTTYLEQNNYAADISAQEAVIAANVQNQLQNIITLKEQERKSGEMSADKLKYTNTKVHEEELAAIEEQKEQDKARRTKLAEQQLANLQVASQGGNYMPSDTVVKNAASELSKYASQVLFKKGDIVTAITLMGASNLNMGPIKAQITDGPYAGAILNGSVSQGTEKLKFTFDSMYLPDDPTLIRVDASALQYDTLELGTATDIDRRAFMRYIVKPLLKGGAAVGDYYANDATTTTTGSGTVVQSSAQKSVENARKVGLGAAMDAISQDINDIDTTTIVKQAQYTQIKVYFNDEAVYGTEGNSPQNMSNKTAQQLGETNAPAQPAQPVPQPIAK